MIQFTRMSVFILESRDDGAGPEHAREIARFTYGEVTRIEVMHGHGKRVWILEGPQWRVEDVPTE